MPPFRSKSQMRYLYSHEPEVAKEFAEKTTNFKNLPEHVKPKKAAKKKASKKK